MKLQPIVTSGRDEDLKYQSVRVLLVLVTRVAPLIVCAPFRERSAIIPGYGTAAAICRYIRKLWYHQRKDRTFRIDLRHPRQRPSASGKHCSICFVMGTITNPIHYLCMLFLGRARGGLDAETFGAFALCLLFRPFKAHPLDVQSRLVAFRTCLDTRHLLVEVHERRRPMP